jgi:hypothetical protein
VFYVVWGLCPLWFDQGSQAVNRCLQPVNVSPETVHCGLLRRYSVSELVDGEIGSGLGFLLPEQVLQHVAVGHFHIYLLSLPQ